MQIFVKSLALALLCYLMEAFPRSATVKIVGRQSVESSVTEFLKVCEECRNTLPSQDGKLQERVLTIKNELFC